MSRVRDGTARGRLDDEVSRAQKAIKILTALESVLGTNLAELTCLDVGCSFGLIAKHLAPHFRYTLGVEYEAEAIREARKWAMERLLFLRGDGQRLPIQDEAVDVVVCTQVYEHVADDRALFAEIERVLVPGGVCFFSGPNRLYPMERHYRLPIVHWLPDAWASRLLRALGRAEGLNVHSATLWTLRRRLRAFEIHDFTVAMLQNPDRYACREEMGRLGWISRLPGWLLHAIMPFAPNFNWVLRKPTRGSQGEPLP